MRSLLTVGALAVLLAVAGRAAAQPAGAERALAEGLFQEGRNLLAAGNVAEACKKFAASYRIDPAGGTLMNLASCHEREGKTATAWADFKEALVVAARTGNKVRQTEAQDRVTALEKRLARLAITPPREPVAGLEVRIDSVPIDADGRSALPVDPGPHTISVIAPGRKAWRADVVAREGITQPVLVPPLEVAGSGVGALPPGPIATPAAGPVEITAAQPWRVPVGATLVALGGVGIIVGAVAGGLVLSQHSTLAAACKNAVCPPTDSSELSTYHAKSTASTVGFIAGGAFAVAGVVVLVTAPKAPAVGVFVGPSATGLRGSF